MGGAVWTTDRIYARLAELEDLKTAQWELLFIELMTEKIPYHIELRGNGDTIVRRYTQQIVLDALRKSHGNRTEAGKLLHMKRTTMGYHVAQLKKRGLLCEHYDRSLMR